MVRILIAKKADEIEKQINQMISEGYRRDGALTTFDFWENEVNVNGFLTGRRIQVTYFNQIMTKDK